MPFTRRVFLLLVYFFLVILSKFYFYFIKILSRFDIVLLEGWSIPSWGRASAGISFCQRVAAGAIPVVSN